MVEAPSCYRRVNYSGASGQLRGEGPELASPEHIYRIRTFISPESLIFFSFRSQPLRHPLNKRVSQSYGGREPLGGQGREVPARFQA